MLIKIISNPTDGQVTASSSVLRMGTSFYIFETAAEKRRVVKLLKRGFSLSQAIAWEGDLPSDPLTKQKAATKAVEEEVQDSLDVIENGEEVYLPAWTDMVREYLKGAVSFEQLSIEQQGLLTELEELGYDFQRAEGEMELYKALETLLSLSEVICVEEEYELLDIYHEGDEEFLGFLTTLEVAVRVPIEIAREWFLLGIVGEEILHLSRVYGKLRSLVSWEEISDIRSLDLETYGQMITLLPQKTADRVPLQTFVEWYEAGYDCDQVLLLWEFDLSSEDPDYEEALLNLPYWVHKHLGQDWTDWAIINNKGEEDLYQIAEEGWESPEDLEEAKRIGLTADEFYFLMEYDLKKTTFQDFEGDMFLIIFLKMVEITLRFPKFSVESWILYWKNRDSWDSIPTIESRYVRWDEWKDLISEVCDRMRSRSEHEILKAFIKQQVENSGEKDRVLEEIECSLKDSLLSGKEVGLSQYTLFQSFCKDNGIELPDLKVWQGVKEIPLSSWQHANEVYNWAHQFCYTCEDYKALRKLLVTPLLDKDFDQEYSQILEEGIWKPEKRDEHKAVEFKIFCNFKRNIEQPQQPLEVWNRLDLQGVKAWQELKGIHCWMSRWSVSKEETEILDKAIVKAMQDCLSAITQWQEMKELERWACRMIKSQKEKKNLRECLAQRLENMGEVKKMVDKFENEFQNCSTFLQEGTRFRNQEFKDFVNFCEELGVEVDFPELEVKNPHFQIQEETEVIPYKGVFTISCSRIPMEQDPRWSDPSSKIWSSTGDALVSYGPHSNLLKVATHKGIKEEYRTGSSGDKWDKNDSWGFQPSFSQNSGAISCWRSVIEEVENLNTNSYDLPQKGQSGWVKDHQGRRGWLAARANTWKVTYEDGMCVKGEQNIPELLAYLKGKLQTEKEAGLPIKGLFMARLVLLAITAYKGRGEDARAAGYKWLHHYLAGSGKDLKMPYEWVEGYLNQMINKAGSDGRIIWNSSDWMTRRGFNGQPHGFYTVGGFIGHLKEGVFSFTDHYDWHPMERTSPNGLGSAKLWCWSEVEGLEKSLMDMVKETKMPAGVKSLVKFLPQQLEKTPIQLLQGLLGPQYFGHSEFFGVSGISNKLWNDLEAVGAKPFNTVFETKI